MKKPAKTWVSVVPTSVSRVTTSPSLVWSVIRRCASLIHRSTWESLALSGPSWSQPRIWPRPATVCSARSLAPLATCWPTKVSSALTVASPPTTTSSAASPRGTRSRASRSTAGTASAVTSSATTIGSTITER